MIFFKKVSIENSLSMSLCMHMHTYVFVHVNVMGACMCVCVHARLWSYYEKHVWISSIIEILLMTVNWYELSIFSN